MKLNKKLALQKSITAIYWKSRNGKVNAGEFLPNCIILIQAFINNSVKLDPHIQCAYRFIRCVFSESPTYADLNHIVFGLFSFQIDILACYIR